MTERVQRPAPGTVSLREVTEADLLPFFEHQRDPVACQRAAFTARERDAFMEHWQRNILGDEEVIKRTVLLENHVAGNLVCFQQDGRWLVGYWIGREHWGRGVATRALALFLGEVEQRPLHALVATSNPASIRVLEKCGFRRVDAAGTTLPADGIGESLYSLC